MYDLIVAGAGPAGSAAARAASAGGLDTLIIEKEEFPRYKPCGGALSKKAVNLLDFPLPREICERTINGARVHFRGKVMEKSKGCTLTTLVTRSRFDNFLLQKAQLAGAGLVTEKVLDYSEKNDHVSVITKNGIYQSRFMVISSGCQDGIKNRIQGPLQKENMGICLVTEIEEEDSLIEKRLGNYLDIHFGVAEMGYGWIFPHKGYYSVGIGGLASRLKHPRKIMVDFLKSNGFREGQRFHGHKIPQGGNSWKTAQGRVMLAGDAAGFVDAFTGEGIYYALRSGQLAAQVIREVPASKVAEAYQSRCKKCFGEELKYALLLSKILHSYPDPFLGLMASQEEILDRYIEIAAAKRSYKEFFWWLLPRLPLNLLSYDLSSFKKKFF